MEKIVFGHKNPDTDTICSAIAVSDLKKELGINITPKRLGELNEETKFVLDYFKIPVPELIDNVSHYEVILVDHNERTQTADGFEEARVIELIDHHRVYNFNVKDPLYMRVEPIGSTASIIYKMYVENNIKIKKEIAGILLSAIISDTLLLKSPTCTEEDIEIANKLANIADLNLENYGLEMLKAGANLSSKTENELLNMDMKIFDISNKKISVSQVNTVNENEILERKDKILEEILKLNKKENLIFSLFVITNILTNNSVGIVLGDELEIIEKTFNEKIIDNQIILKNIVSRKKQIIPPLTDTIQRL